VLPEHSTNVGDLIQPVPGVLYEDSKLKKGDTRRYKVYHERFFFLYSFILEQFLIEWNVKIYKFL
jgi:hypothetical protein